MSNLQTVRYTLGAFIYYGYQNGNNNKDHLQARIWHRDERLKVKLLVTISNVIVYYF